MTERLGALLLSVLKQTEQAHGTLWALQRQWGTLVGPGLAAHTRPASLRRGRLTIHADRPGDSFALHYARATLLERLRAASDGKVEALLVRPEEAPGRARPRRRSTGTRRGTHGVSR